MEHNAELLRRTYEAFAEGDVEGALAHLTDDIRWEGPRATGLPDSGTFHGKDEVAWMFRHAMNTYGIKMRLRPDEFVEEGQTIVVLGHLEGTRNGTELSVPYAHVWRFDRGRVTRVQTLFDTAYVKESLGV